MYLWAVEGYSTSELAEFLEMPRGTLLSKIHRLRIRVERHCASVWEQDAG